MDAAATSKGVPTRISLDLTMSLNSLKKVKELETSVLAHCTKCCFLFLPFIQRKTNMPWRDLIVPSHHWNVRAGNPTSVESVPRLDRK
jgi:hypothetical protein